MKKAKKAAIAALACAMVLGCGGAVVSGCKKKPVPAETIHSDILNGGFETGDLTGWKTAGDMAFDVDGVVEDEKVEGLGFSVGGKVGTYYFNGLAATNATSTGTLTSEPFTLGGTGKIGFKIGAGSDNAKCFVEFIEHGTNTVLKKVSNEAYDAGFIEDELVRVVVDLSGHIGKNIYIKVTDNGTTQNSHEYLHLDDFVVYKDEAAVTAAEAERTSLVRMYGRPVFENDTPEAKTIKNGNFEDGLNNWQVMEGDAYTPKSISPSTEKFWTTREHNAEGSYFLDGYALGEDRIGKIRSTTFTLSETGIISFLLGNAGVHTIYVAVCNDEAIGDIEAGTELFKVYADEKFSDPNCTLNLLRRYIDASKYTPEDGEPVSLIGKKLYIKLVDNASTGPFGAVNFDDVRCSMTEQEVLDLSVEDYLWATNLTGRGSEEIKATQKYYNDMNYPFGLPLMRFTAAPAGKSFNASATKVDVAAYLDDVKAVYAHAKDDEFEYEIVKIDYDGNEITSDFNEVIFDKVGLATVTYRAVYKTDTAVEPLEGKFIIDVVNENMIQNGGFETGDLTGWTVVDGSVNVADAVSGAEFGFTSASYNQGGKYHFDGANAADENKTYTLKSTGFVLGGSGIISFKLGGRAATLRVYDATSGGLLGEYKNTQWNDSENPHVEKGCRNLTMTTYYADLSDFIGLTLYIEISDTETSNWGVAHFDDIVTYYGGDKETVLAELAGKYDEVHYACSWDQSGEVKSHEGNTTIPWVEAVNEIVPELVQITDKADAYVEVIGAQTGYDLSQHIGGVNGAVIGVEKPALTSAVKDIYDGETLYTENLTAFNLEAGKTYTVTYTLTYNDGTQDYTAEAEFVIKVVSEYEIRNGGFELGTLDGWTHEQGTGEGKIAGNAAISSDETHWGERIPHNKSGNYFFNGWNANNNEVCAYHLTSTKFTLGGSGVISFKLGGNATVLKVFLADGTQIAEFSNTEFADVNFPHVEQGGRWGTMTTYYADLHEYIGQQLYIELHDVGNPSGWGVAFFDDIVTYYEGSTDAVLTALAAKADTVNIYCEYEGDTYDIDWVLAQNEYVATEAPEESGE